MFRLRATFISLSAHRDLLKKYWCNLADTYLSTAKREAQAVVE